MSHKARISLLSWFLVGLILAGCALPQNGSPTSDGASPAPTDTIVPPTATATRLPGLVVLQLGSRARRISTPALAAELASLSAESNLEFSQLSDDEDIPPNALLVVTLGAAVQAAELARARPETTVIIIGDEEGEQEGNLILLGDFRLVAERAAFLAGFLGAMLTADHRTGMISTQESEDEGWRRAFRTGQQYFCGLCRPAFPPFVEYPVFASVPAGFGEQEFGVILNELRQQDARTIFIAPLGDSPHSLPATFPEELTIISADDPSEVTSGVDILLRPAPELALAQNWSSLIAGDALESLDIPLTIDRLNPDRFSEARLRLAENILADLNSGFISID